MNTLRNRDVYLCARTKYVNKKNRRQTNLHIHTSKFVYAKIRMLVLKLQSRRRRAPKRLNFVSLKMINNINDSPQSLLKKQVDSNWMLQTRIQMVWERERGGNWRYRIILRINILTQIISLFYFISMPSVSVHLCRELPFSTFRTLSNTLNFVSSSCVCLFVCALQIQRQWLQHIGHIVSRLKWTSTFQMKIYVSINTFYNS